MMTKNPTPNRKPLLVARESAVGTEAKALLAVLFGTLVREVQDDVALPDFSDVIDVYENPGHYGAQVFDLAEGKAVLVEGDESDLLLSLGTARKLNEDGDNEFVECLATALESGAYSRVITTSFSRLCRSTVAAGRLQHVLATRRIPLEIGRMEIQVWKSSDQVIWMMYSWFAEFEARTIEARLLAGKISRLEAGQWRFGFAPPPGWKLDGKQVVLDPEVADAVRFVIQQICDGETNLAEIARQVSRRWPNLEARRGGGAWNKAGDATAIARSWLNQRWYRPYTDNLVELEFIPHAVRQAIKSGVELEPGDIVRIAASLPPQPEPIATHDQIERVKAFLAVRSEAVVGRATPGSTFGSGIGHPESEVEIVGIRL